MAELCAAFTDMFTLYTRWDMDLDLRWSLAGPACTYASLTTGVDDWTMLLHLASTLCVLRPLGLRIDDLHVGRRLGFTLVFVCSLCYVRAVVRDILNLASFRTF